MGFNYSKEQKKFEMQWKKTRTECLDAGMSEGSITQLYQFDLATFHSNRSFSKHTQPFPDLNNPERTGMDIKLHQKFKSLSCTIDEGSFSGDYAWIDTIDSPIILQRLQFLSSKDVEILTLYALEEYNQQEIAHIMGCHQSVISRRIKKIKKILKG